MKKSKWFVSVLIGGLILFIWNALSWMALPFHSGSMKNLPEMAIHTDEMNSMGLDDGIYHYPGLPDDKLSIEEIERKLTIEPRITMMVVKKPPSEFMKGSTFLWSLILNCLTAMLILMLVQKFSGDKVRNVFTTCLIMALITVVVYDFGQMNWYKFPLRYTLINGFDRVISFSFLALFYSLYTFK